MEKTKKILSKNPQNNIYSILLVKWVYEYRTMALEVKLDFLIPISL